MDFFDMHVHSAFSAGESSIEQLAGMAQNLGYKGICFSEYFENENQVKRLYAEIKKVKEKVGIQIFLGFEARDTKDLSRLIERRRKFDVLLVHGGDLRLNRIVCETPEVDILTHPEMDRNDSGLNHILVKQAAENGVAIEINLREILLASRKSRSKILQNIAHNVMLAKKFGAQLIVCSGAISHYELRDPHVMVSTAVQVGLTFKEAQDAVTRIPQMILQKTAESKSEKWIMPGVKIV